MAPETGVPLVLAVLTRAVPEAVTAEPEAVADAVAVADWVAVPMGTGLPEP